MEPLDTVTSFLDRVRRWGLEFGWVLSGQALAFLGALVSIKVLTATLGPSAYGELALGLTIAGVLHMFLYGPIEQVVLRYVAVYRERGELDVFFTTVRTLHLRVAAAVVVTLACIIALIHAVAGGAWSALVLAGLLFGLASGINATFSSLHTAFRHRKVVAMHQSGDVWLRLAFAFAAIFLIGPQAPAALLGFLVATVLITLSQLTAIRTTGVAVDFTAPIDSAAQRRAWAEFFRYGSPYVWFALFAWLGAYSDRWIILNYLDAHAVGMYAAAFQIANAPVALFVGMTNQFLVPLIFERAGTATTTAQVRASTRLLYRALVVYVVTIPLLVAAAYYFAEPLIVALTSAEFAPVASLVWLICSGLGLVSIGQLLVIKGLCYNRPQDYIWPKVLQTVALLAAALALVGPLGLTGIALALCISGVVYIAATALANCRLALPAS